jgi:hypothetical protein
VIAWSYRSRECCWIAERPVVAVCAVPISAWGRFTARTSSGSVNDEPRSRGRVATCGVSTVSTIAPKPACSERASTSASVSRSRR